MIDNLKIIKLSFDVLFEQNRKLVDAFKNQKINIVQFRILNMLINKKVNTVNELAELIGIKPSSISVAVDNLEKLGYLKRKQSKEDKRSFILKPLLKGRAEVLKILNFLSHDVMQILNSLEEDEKKLLISLLKKLKAQK